MKNKNPTRNQKTAPAGFIDGNIPAEVRTQKENNPLHPILAFFFDAEIPRIYQPASFFLIAVLYIAGVFHWVLFLKIDGPYYLSHDWWLDYNYYGTLKSAVTYGVIPFHSSNIMRDTTRFLAIPETMSIFSPQILLLYFMRMKDFMLVNILLLYSIGFWGCLRMKRHFRMSLFAFSVFYLLFNYNGHIICHIAVGNIMWIGYFLFPFLLLYLFELCGAAPTYESAVKLALVLFFMILEGSFHMVTMFMMFFGFLMIFDFRNIKRLATAAGLGGLLCLFRIWPAMITVNEQAAIPVHGYTLTNLISGLALTQHPLYFPMDGIIVGSWEFDQYITPIGLLLIVFCGVIARFMPEIRNSNTRYTALMWATLALTLLSMYDNWALLRGIIPFKVGERVPSRFLVVPLLVLTTLACVRMNLLRRWLYGRNFTAILCIVGLLTSADMLFMHSSDWVARELLNSGNYTDPALVKGYDVLDIEDSTYKTIVIVSLAISAAALLGASVFLLYSGPMRHRFDYLWVGAFTLWIAFMGTFLVCSEREPHQADAQIQVISGFPAYVYKCFMPGYSGLMLKVIFKEPLMLHTATLFGTTGYPENRVGGIMEFAEGKAIETGRLPVDGSSKTVSFQPALRTPWLVFLSKTGGDPNHVLKSLQVEATPLEQ